MKPVAMAVLCAAALACCAQPQPAPENEVVERFVPVKNLTGPSRIQRLVGLLKVYDIGVSGDDVLRVITLRGKRSAVAEAEKTITQYDVARRSTVEIVAYLLGASEDPAKGGTVPGGLEPVTKELSRIFGYQSFGLRESAILRVSEGGSATASGYLPVAPHPGNPRIFRLEMEGAEVVSDTQGRIVRVNRFQFNTQAVRENPPLALHLTAGSLDLREGQSVILGKSNLHESGDVVVVVLNARVVN